MTAPLAAHERKVRDLGPYSHSNRVARVDRRTKYARLMQEVQAELLEHIGQPPNPVERMLIERAAVLSLRLAQIDKKIFAEQEFTILDNNQAVAWQNALTRTLVALGVHREAARNGTTTSAAVLAEMMDDA
jgi:hypothetical protein